MRVQVLRVTGMPCDVAVWIKRSSSGTLIRVDAELVTEEGARLLEAAFNYDHHRWQRAPKEASRPALTVHTG